MDRNTAEEVSGTPAIEEAQSDKKLSKKELNRLAARAKKAAAKAKDTGPEITTKIPNLPVADPSKDNYGRMTTDFPTGFASDATLVNLYELNDQHVAKMVILRTWVQHTQSSSAKLVFAELREESTWTVQAVAASNVTPDGVPPSGSSPAVSRAMVKFINTISPESFVAVEVQVNKPNELVKSCRVSGLELHITKCYVLATAPPVLGMGLTAAAQAIVDFGDTEKEDDKSECIIPTATMLTHLNKIAMHKRAPVQQAIAV